jgi:precorrin-6A/cobalt-precorrin-6A reductase
MLTYRLKMDDQVMQALPRVLILGGTAEGSALATCLVSRTDIAVTSSLAGRVDQPKLPSGEFRVGGFGGVDGLIRYLDAEKIVAVIDATHPYASRISHNAEQACKHLGLPLIALARPPWKRMQQDKWHEVEDLRSAAHFVDSTKRRVFLSIGRQELEAFADCENAWYLIRAIDKPTSHLPLHHELILQRGPFSLGEELQLLKNHTIDCVISKNSGGPATYAKIEAARLLNIPVVMIRRPLKHTGESVETIGQAILQLDAVLDNLAKRRPL